MKRILFAWAILWGLDRETAEERAFRHERERILLSMAPVATSGLVMALMIQVLLSPTTWKIVQTLVLGILAEMVIFLTVNAVFKWHQRKYGGD